MSAGAAVQAAAMVALAAEPALAGVPLFDAPPPRAGPPAIMVDEPVLADWGAKGWTGREAVLTVRARDAAERPARLREVAGGIEAALMRIAPADGWTLAGVRLLRSRIARVKDEWVATVEARVRVYRPD